MLRLLLLSCTLVPIHCRIQGFYLLDENKEYTNNGLLIADKISGHKPPDQQIGSVCDDNFDDNAATVICREMKFNVSVSFASGAGTQYSSWRMKREFPIVLDDITCDTPDLPFASCSIVTEHDCNAKNEQVFLECGCSNDSYIRPQYRGCSPCPEGSVGPGVGNMSCVCGAGMVWDNEQCNACPVNTYKDAPDEAPCQPCPEYSTSAAGAGSCSCEAGYFWNNGNCFKCPVGSVSSVGSVQCVSCPSGSTPIQGNTACSCTAGLYWNSTHCTTCSVNTYSTHDSTACSQCPENTVSEPGSAHCTHCPLGHVWQSYTCVSCSDIDHDSCPRCPPGYTITPGNLCIENEVPEPDAEEHKSAPKNWSTIVLAICLAVLFAFIVILALMLFRTRRRRRPPKSAAPLVPYTTVHGSDTSYNYDYEEPEYERPNPTGQAAIYEEPRGAQYEEPPHGAQYVEPDPMYVQSDRGEMTEDCAYVQADSTPGYSAFCGNERESQGDGFTDNIYDNI